MSAPDTAMVLAAGLGTRMRPLTNDRPKPLVEAAGRTLIDRTLDRLREIDVRRAVVNLHYLPDMMRVHLADEVSPSLDYSDETGCLLETGGGVVNALPKLGAAPFLVVNSDNIWLGENALRPLLDRWNPEEMDVLLLMVPIDLAVGYTRDGDFSLDASDRLVRRGERPSAPLVFTGAQIIKPEVFAGAPEGPFSLNVIWDALIAKGRAFGVVQPDGWCDVGTPDGLKRAETAMAATG